MPESLVVNELDLRRSRLASVFGALDAKRPTAWSQYGYPQEVSFDQLFQAYRRGGAAHGAVHRILDKCWQKLPRIKQPQTDEPGDWEKAIDQLLRSVQGWRKLRDLDRRNMVGRYAALIYRVADSKKLRDPLVTATKLVDIVPLYESQIKVSEWWGDSSADNFGTPRMFQYRSMQPNAAQDTQGKPEEWVDVHPSRVQILAEGSVGDMFEGVPLLQAGYNQLVDIEKISGGSAESYLKNSARTLVVKFDAAASPTVITQNPDGSSSGKSVQQVIEEKTRNLNESIDASIATQGAEVTTLQTLQSSPTSAFEVAANLFAASVQIPFTILFGQQTGRLASDEDKADMIARCASRQANELTPMLEEMVMRLQACGLVKPGEFEIEWPPLDAPGDDEKFAQLVKLTSAMKQAFDAGLTEPLFDANELRNIGGFERRADDGMPTEADQEAALQAERDHALAMQAARGGAEQKPPSAKPRAVA